MSDSNNSKLPIDIVRDHRELFERLANTNLPVAEDAQQGLALLDEDAEGGSR